MIRTFTFNQRTYTWDLDTHELCNANGHRLEKMPPGDLENLVRCRVLVEIENDIPAVERVRDGL